MSSRSPEVDQVEPALTRQGNPWWVVAASFSALMMGTGTMTYALGIFMKPVTADLAIGRGTFSAGILLFTTLASLACPFLGTLLDRWGSRRVVLPLILAFSIAVGLLSLLNASPVVLLFLFALAGLTGVGLTPIPYARAISLRFARRRGLALGVGVAGIGFGLVLMPQLIGWIIRTHGWRSAFIAYGALTLVLAFVPVAAFIRENPRPRRDDSPKVRVSSGLSPAEAARSWRFWALLVTFLFAMIAVNGTVSHMVPLLIDRGVPMSSAINAVSLVGIVATLSRIVCGWMLDVLPGALVGATFFLLPIVGIALVTYGGVGLLPSLGAVLLGSAIGAEVDMLAYFVGGYFGLRAFGIVYGALFAAFGIGAGLGPFISGSVFDAFHSYRGVFAIYMALLAVASVLVSCLGPYRYATGHRTAKSNAAGSGSVTAY